MIRARGWFQTPWNFLVVCAGILSLAGAGFRDQEEPISLHSGWKISPAGKHETTGDMLLGCALSPDGRMLAVTNVGYAEHMLHIVDTSNGRIGQSLPLGRAWNGVAWSPDGTSIYVSGGASPQIHVYRKSPDGSLMPARPIRIPDLAQDAAKEPGKGQAYVAGLAMSGDGTTLYAANIATDTIYAIDPAAGSVRRSRKLEDGARPYCLRLAPEGSKLYVTQWALSSLLALNSGDLETVQTLETGNHPNDLLFSGDGRLFVSCGNDDAVFVHDARSGAQREKIRVAMTAGSPAGTTPNALALAPDGKTLYVANADNNAVAVVDVARPGRSRVKGLIPTGWYPTAVAVSRDSRRLFIGSGKGLGTRPNPVSRLPINPVAPTGFEYIGRMLGGLISTLEIPDDARLAGFTRQVHQNSPYSDALIEKPAQAPPRGNNPVPSRLGDSSPIKYVLYIIKENRTYDQVFGGFRDHNGKPRGNGDPNLTLFGEEVTPNHHELARQFVLLDNTFCSGEVSADGHPWSTGAYVTDITSRTWPVQYAGRGRQPLTEKVTVPPAGYIWDLCAAKGLSYRSYGEYVYASGPDAPPGPLTSTDGVTGLKGHASAGWQAARAAGKRDFEKAEVFVRELAEFERTGSLPRFMIMSLGEDHTSGTRPGAFTPKASVASNDLALGRIVEACTRSRYWKDMAIFVIEDDAQNGPDHVDAHRTVALVISPYAKRRHLDSTFYTTVSMLRTIELILGLPPMSQYDAAAAPMYGSFAQTADARPYTALPARIDLMEKNADRAYGARESMGIDFSEYDLLTLEQEDTLNRALWHSIKGEHVPYPVPVRGALFARSGRSAVPLRPEGTESTDR